MVKLSVGEGDWLNVVADDNSDNVLSLPGLEDWPSLDVLLDGQVLPDIDLGTKEELEADNVFESVDEEGKLVLSLDQDRYSLDLSVRVHQLKLILSLLAREQDFNGEIADLPVNIYYWNSLFEILYHWNPKNSQKRILGKVYNFLVESDGIKIDENQLMRLHKATYQADWVVIHMLRSVLVERNLRKKFGEAWQETVLALGKEYNRAINIVSGTSGDGD